MSNNILSKLTSKFKDKMYAEETGYLLNYLTLHIKDAELTNQVSLHIGKQFERIMIPGTLIVCLGCITTCINLFVYNSGHPINLITNGIDILFTIILWTLVKSGKSYLCRWTTVPFFFSHSMAIVCVYKDWLPDYFNRYPKANTENMIMLMFIAVNAVPLINFKQTIFVMCPILIATSTV